MHEGREGLLPRLRKGNKIEVSTDQMDLREFSAGFGRVCRFPPPPSGHCLRWSHFINTTQRLTVMEASRGTGKTSFKLTQMPLTSIAGLV